MRSFRELYVIYGMYVESCTILVVVNRLTGPVVVLDGLPGLYEFKYDSATACGLLLYLYSYKLVSSVTPKKQNQQVPQGQNSNHKGRYLPPPNTRKVNHVSVDTAQEAPKVMLGMFSVNYISATILFYFGASHSFISQAFVRMHSIPLCAIKNPILVNSLGGSMPTSYCYPSASISLRG